MTLLAAPSVLAATYTVGDNTGWATPISGDPYATWASQQTFVVGDVLVFSFTTGSHTVANVTKSSFDGCNTANTLSVETNGPARFTIDTAGSHYFICTLLNHCTLNQKLAITTNANTNTNTTTGNAPSPGSPPGAPSPFSPPRDRGSNDAPAMAATGTLSLVFIGLLVYLN
uniref:umecyanin-like n=1 Tax=Erigeron canadensis TaxID=72917 RepID=UPI001CB91C1F|nr:umecyanin-like [Erigeron canadensis]